jgi:hypothetical protein
MREARRDLHLLVELAGQVEIGIHAEPRAGAVLAVLVEHQPLARHDVEHAVGHRARHPAAVVAAAVLRPAALVLRPQPVQHEGIGAPALPVALRIAAPVAGIGAIGGAPRQREHVIVEHAGLAALRQRRAGNGQGERCDRDLDEGASKHGSILSGRIMRPRRIPLMPRQRPPVIPGERASARPGTQGHDLSALLWLWVPDIALRAIPG